MTSSRTAGSHAPTASSDHTDRTVRARTEPLAVERLAPGLFEVHNRRAGTHYRVDIAEQVCECDDFRYNTGPAGEPCKHIRFIEQISAGELCPTCGYSHCRPSCPRRDADDHASPAEADNVE